MKLSCSSRSAGCRWSWSGSKKSLTCSDARELRKLVDHDHPELSVSRQCVLLGLPRSTLYYRPMPVPESPLRIMARIDALYLEGPWSGSRRMVDYLAREGIPISRDRVRNLMSPMGLRAIYQKPRTTVQGNPSERFPCLVDVNTVTACWSDEPCRSALKDALRVRKISQAKGMNLQGCWHYGTAIAATRTQKRFLVRYEDLPTGVSRA